MKPWGHLDWILRWYPDREWTLISGVGFEPRCTAIFAHIRRTRVRLMRAVALRIDDPPNEHTQQINAQADQNEREISGFFPALELLRIGLFVRPEYWVDFVSTAVGSGSSSILLDVSTLPKRVFFFLLKLLIRDDSVRDLVVCYVAADGYREGLFVQDVLPPAALPGFGVTSSEYRDSAFVVSVGYVTFDLRAILQEAGSPDVHFLMPFPPASPSFRRTWRYLKVLNDALELANPSIERFGATDMFSVYEWLIGHIDPKKNTTMLPLGPKPHSVAMALAQMGHATCSEVVYPQPQTYHPDYTLATALELDGTTAITAYGIRRDHQSVILLDTGHDDIDRPRTDQAHIGGFTQ